jgi:hypothetical protein
MRTIGAHDPSTMRGRTRRRPTKFEIDGKRMTMEFRDGWRVG